MEDGGELLDLQGLLQGEVGGQTRSCLQDRPELHRGCQGPLRDEGNLSTWGDFPEVTAIVARKLGEIEDPSERSRLWRVVSEGAEAVERTPTLEDVEQAMAKMAKRDQKLDEWRERYRKRDERE